MKVRSAGFRLCLIGNAALLLLLPTILHAESNEVGTPAIAGWWRSFRDQRLSELVEEALSNAPDARMAKLRLEEARAIRSRTLRELDPRGSVTGFLVRQQSSGGSIITTGDSGAGTGFGASAGALSVGAVEVAPQVDLDLLGRRQANRAVAAASYDQAKIELEESRRRLTLSVGFALNDARLLELQWRDAIAQATLARAAVTARRTLASRGIAPAADAVQLAAAEKEALAKVIDLEARVEIAKREILILVGRPDASAKNLALGQLGALPTVAEDFDSKQVFQRADIMLSEAQLRAAIGRKRLKRLALYPSFSLLGAASLTDISGPGGYTSTLWSLGAGIVLPIFNRGRLLAEAHVASLQAEMASVSFEKAVQTAFADARNAKRVESSDNDRLAVLESAEASARALLRAEQTSLAKGYGDSFVVWSAERAWLVSKAELQVAHFKHARDVMNLVYAVGGAQISQPIPSGRK